MDALLSIYRAKEGGGFTQGGGKSTLGRPSELTVYAGFT